MNCEHVTLLSDEQLQEIESCKVIDECPGFIQPSKMSRKTQSITNQKLGRYSIAKEKIFCGEEVVTLNGTLVDRPFRWTIQLSDNVHISGSGAINHRCTNPNLFIDLGQMAMVARRDIEIGEELTVNYLTFERELSTPFECFCDSENGGCYSNIKGFDFLTFDQKNKLRQELGVLPYLIKIT